MAKKVGIKLNEEQTRKYGWKFHRTFGIASGIQYLMMRRMFPKLALGWGLLFGFSFFVVVDEILMTVNGWVPGPQKFPWQAHARGLASHVAYGLAAETTARALETFVPAMHQASEYARKSSEFEGHSESFSWAP